MKSISGDDLEDWKSKLTKAIDEFQVRRHLLVCDSFLICFLLGDNPHKNSGRSDNQRSWGTFAFGRFLVIKDASY